MQHYDKDAYFDDVSFIQFFIVVEQKDIYKL